MSKEIPLKVRNLDHELTGGAKLPEEQLKKVENLYHIWKLNFTKIIRNLFCIRLSP